MRDALIEEMKVLESQLADANDRFMFYVEKGLPLATEQTLQLIQRLSKEWERLNKHLKDVHNALLERRLRTRLAERLGSEQRLNYLDHDNQELLRITKRGLADVTPPEREGLGANLIGRIVARLLRESNLVDFDIEPETEPCVGVKGIAVACPLVASQKVLGALHIVLPDDLAHYYLYNRVPMPLAHQAAIAFYAAKLATEVGSHPEDIL